MYSLNKSQRLKSRKKIERTFAEGKVLQSFPIRIVYLLQPADSYSVKAGFTASSRNFKKAKDRNRIKRLMREAYRMESHALQDSHRGKPVELSLFLIFTGRELMSLDVIKEKTGLLMDRLIKILWDEVA